MTVIRNELNEKAHFTERALRKVISQNTNRNIKNLNSSVKSLADIIKLRITLVNYNGIVLVDSQVNNPRTMDNHNYRIEIIAARRNGTGNSTRYSNTIKASMMYFAIRSGKKVIRLSKPLHVIKNSLLKTRSIIIFSGLIIFFSSIIVIIIITKRITGPINESISFAENFSAGDYSRRIINYSDDEIGTLQKSLNSLADIILDKINSLILEQNKLEVTIETIDDGIAVIDTNKEIIICNKAFNKFIGYEDNAKNHIYHEVINNTYLNENISKSLRDEQVSTFKKKITESRYCEVFINPIKDSNSNQGILIVLHDLSESKRLEEMKTDLIGNMSHEFKTPIAILKGYLETIDENFEDREMTQDMIKRALRNLDRQTSLVNDILTLNRLETTDDFYDEVIHIDAMIHNCIEILAIKADEKKITIDNKLSDSITYKGNRFLAEEVFFNIIDNAINYNKKNGFIELRAQIDNLWNVIIIKDTGIGIPKNALYRIFERFYRVDKSRSRATGGTGLGLSIVKHAVELLKWKIEVTSDTTGTTFHIYIPK